MYYKVTYQFITALNRDLRSGTVIVEASSSEQAEQLAAELIDAKDLPWSKIVSTKQA